MAREKRVSREGGATTSGMSEAGSQLCIDGADDGRLIFQLGSRRVKLPAVGWKSLRIWSVKFAIRPKKLQLVD